MELKDIRPAIARQNVKWVPTGEIADLICYYDEKIFENTFIVKRQDWTQEAWPFSKCELLPESPRPFRVGDHVCHEWRSEPSCKNYCTVLSIETCMEQDDNIKLSDGMCAYGSNAIRHCSPEEEAKYFA